MENENKTPVQETEQPKEPQGWKDVQITPDMPLSAMVGFLNVLNQRLCALENLVPVQVGEGKTISVTEFYAQQEAEQRKQMEAEAAKQKETKGE